MRRVEIRVERDYHSFTIRVFADGQPIEAHPAHLGNVVAVRNRLAERWSDLPDVSQVDAGAIPWPAEYNRVKPRWNPRRGTDPVKIALEIEQEGL